MARVNESLREVIAEELEVLDDDRLQLVTVTGIAVDPDFRRATVWFSALTVGASLEQVGAALGEYRVRLQAAVGRQLRLKRTPELSFKPDPAIIEGDRIESILRAMPRSVEVVPSPRADPVDPVDPTGLSATPSPVGMPEPAVRPPDGEVK